MIPAFSHVRIASPEKYPRSARTSTVSVSNAVADMARRGLDGRSYCRTDVQIKVDYVAEQAGADSAEVDD